MPQRGEKKCSLCSKIEAQRDFSAGQLVYTTNINRANT